ncbi:MAG TPA: MFS transporter, partial [Microbacterium sp.]|nr:MFS transporter [Microbacterium sp.]
MTQQTERPIATHLPARTIAAAITVLVCSAFLMILNETVLAVALPRLMSDFSITATTGQWLTTGFMLTLGVAIPATGALLQRHSVRTLFAVSAGFFLFGTVLAAVAPTFGIMMTARVVQACGTAISMPLLMVTTLNIVPKEHRGTVMGLGSVVISVAPALGPAGAGAVIQSLSWHWLFGLMLPLGGALLVTGLIAIRLPHEPRQRRIDVPSLALSTAGFGGLVYGLSSIGAVVEGMADVAT